jgi:hypothetical protein
MISWICKIRWSVKDKLDREALEGILGSFRWLINLWFILLTPSTFTFCTSILVHHVLSYVVVPQESPVRDGWDPFKWEPTSCLRLITFCYTWWYRMPVMRGMDEA